MKIYCKNCKFNQGELFVYCKPLHGFTGKREDDYYSKNHARGFYKEKEKAKENEKNDCSYYWRKWWKFWIRKQRG